MFWGKKRKTAKQNIEEPKEETGSLFLLGEEDDLEKIMQTFFRAFGIESSPGGNTLQLCEGDICVRIIVTTVNMPDDAKEFVKEQAGKVMGHFYAVNAMKPDVKTNLVHQLELVKSVVSVVYTFEPQDREHKLETIKAPLLNSLADLGAVLLVMEKPETKRPDGIYYRDEDGRARLILDENGKSDVDIYMPYSLNKPDMTGAPEEALARREASRRQVVSRGIYVPAFYPLIETKEIAHIRTPEEIAKRAVALLAVSLYSEAMLGDKLSPKEAYDGYVKGIIECFGAEKFFSPKEWEYLHDENSSEQDRISYSWQYENLYVMEWALGLGKEAGPLDFPDSICDVPYTVRVLRDCATVEDILNISKPKSAEELLDECDLIFCLDWACVDTRIKRLPAPAGMDGGVVMERHKSLNWLIGAYDNADWDDVSTDT